MQDFIETFIVDSFTDQPFKGNPAGLCLLVEDLEIGKMLSIAKELRLSETAFVRKMNKQNHYAIRFFSPKMEIPLCGHATLAAAKVLFEKYPLKEIHFINIQNLDLMMEKEGEFIKMRFPVYGTIPEAVPDALLSALGIDKVLNSVYNEETNILLLEIDDSQELNNLRPNFEALYRSHSSINGVLVTARSEQTEYDFESRYFWPWSGTNEDPVTGGTHTFLVKYWSERLSKTIMRSFQCSERTGFMEVELIGDSQLIIKGLAQIILEGKFRV